MLFRHDDEGVLAISQPMHAWISGLLLRATPGNFGDALKLAAEQHDIAWMDWETEPSFDVSTGRPHLFRDVGAFLHAPMWRRGVERALAAWGPHVALLISRHGGVIYKRFTTRHRTEARDAEAAQAYLRDQAPREAEWAAALKLSPAELDVQSAWIAFVDNLSLAVCGELPTPLELDSPHAGRVRIEADAEAGLRLSPWPFSADSLVLEGEGARLPEGGRFADEAAFQAWRPRARRATFSVRLRPA
jgi:hypothetical protein